MIYLDPKNDVAFRKIFGEHKDLCISLLNALLPLPEDGLIESIEYQPLDVLPERIGGKCTVVDVKCADQKGRQFLVEMQLFWNEAFIKRFILNSAKTYANQLDKGSPYKSLYPVYSLCILNDRFVKHPELESVYRHIFQFRHETFPELKFEDITLVFVELPKFRSDNRVHNKMAHLWLEFLTTIKNGDETVAPELLENADTAKALDILQIGSFSKAELNAYDLCLDRILYEDILVQGNRDQGYAEGMKEGMKEGIEKGMKEGMKEGMEKGMKEAQNHIIQNMISNGFDRDTILKLTGVDIGE